MNKNFVYIFLFLFVAGLVQAAQPSSCNRDDGFSHTGSDYFTVMNSTYNLTGLTTNQQFKAFTDFTPRLNFTITISDSSFLLNASRVLTLDFYGINNLTILNSSNLSQSLGSGNYSVNYTTSVVTFNATDLTAAGWIDQTIVARYNRTFVACKLTMTAPTDCDDLSGTNYASICTHCSNLITYVNTSVGEDTAFRLTDSRLNSQNWAVEWDYYTETCLSCHSGVAGILFTALMTMFMIGVLVFIAYSAYQSGSLDLKMIIAFIVAIIIMVIMIPVINNTILSVCQA